MADHPLPIIDLDQIADAGARHAICGLLNVVEELMMENRTLRAEVQRLHDEHNRLKGEQGQPTIKANTKPTVPAGDHSSERERRRPTPRHVRSKLQEIVVATCKPRRLGLQTSPGCAHIRVPMEAPSGPHSVPMNPHSLPTACKHRRWPTFRFLATFGDGPRRNMHASAEHSREGGQARAASTHWAPVDDMAPDSNARCAASTPRRDAKRQDPTPPLGVRVNYVPSSL